MTHDTLCYDKIENLMNSVDSESRREVLIQVNGVDAKCVVLTLKNGRLVLDVRTDSY